MGLQRLLSSGRDHIAVAGKLNEGSSAFDDRELAKHGWTIQQAIRFAVEHLRKQEGSVTVAEAVTALVAQKKAEGKTERYQNDIENRLDRLSEVMPETKIANVTTADLDKFLCELTVAAGTKNTFRRDIRTLWSFAEKRGWAEAKTAKHTGRASTVSVPPVIFTPEDAAALLAANGSGESVTACGVAGSLVC